MSSAGGGAASFFGLNKFALLFYCFASLLLHCLPASAVNPAATKADSSALRFSPFASGITLAIGVLRSFTTNSSPFSLVQATRSNYFLSRLN